MKPAILYHGQLNSAFAVRQDWGKYSLAIIAGDEPVSLDEYRLRGMKVLSYTHPADKSLDDKIFKFNNDGIFLDLAVGVDKQELNELYVACMVEGKIFAINSGWGSNERVDYGEADLVMVESFIGSVEEGSEAVSPPYYLREPLVDVKKVWRFKEMGYQVVTLSYGASDDYERFSMCYYSALDAGADYFIYTQSPAWEKPGAGFRFWRELHG
jgi:hypothetical protein